MKRTTMFVSLFLASLSLFLFEIVMNRLASVVLFYHFAFFIIAMALLGSASGGIVVFLRPDYFSQGKAPLRMYEFSIGLAVAIPLVVILIFLLSAFLWSYFPWGVILVILAWGILLFIPFAVGGVVITLGITRLGLSTGVAYAANLLGASAGCMASIFLLRWIDGASAVLIAGILAALAAVGFGRTTSFPSSRKQLIPLLLVLILSLSSLVNVVSARPPFRPWYVMGDWSGPYTYTKWNSYSFITVSETKNARPSHFGPFGRNMPNPLFQKVPYRIVRIDGEAMTPMLQHGQHYQQHQYLKWALRLFVFRLRQTGPAAILGVGAGAEVVEAARVGLTPIVGIDINNLIIRLHTDIMPDFSGLTNIPGVRLVHQEARRYLTETSQKFSVISMSFVDSWASMGGGAYGTFALSENALYTTEAWQTILGRLKRDGLFTVTRWFNPRGAGETSRILSLAMASLWKIGVEKPREHIAIIRAGKTVQAATTIVSRTPFSEQEKRRLQKTADRIGVDIVLSPDHAPSKADLKRLANASSPAELKQRAALLPLDLFPPTDDRPYFFNMLTFRSFLKGTILPDYAKGPLLGNFLAIYSLLASLVVSLLLALLVLVGPMMKRLEDLWVFSWVELAAIFTYFSLIGLGFMFVEIGLLGRLNTFLGHPTLAMSVALGGMIFFAGLGSLVSERLSVHSRFVLAGYPLLIGVVILLLSGSLEEILHATRTLSRLHRVSLGTGLVGIVALPMGLALPLGFRFVNAYTDTQNKAIDVTPWLWCVNGVTSVLGSGIALTLALHWGIQIVLLTAGCFYLCLAFIFPLLLQRI